MSSKGTSRSNPPRPRQTWWVGPAVVYLCMFAAMMLSGMASSVLGPEARLVEGKENVLLAEENLTFGIATPGESLLVENGVIELVLEFTNPTGSTVVRTYVLNFDGQEENITVSLAPGESTQKPIMLRAEGLTTGAHTLKLVDSENYHTVWETTVRWGSKPVSDFISYGITFSVALSIVYLHVCRFEGRKKFWSSVGIKREGLIRSFIWVFALYVIFVSINSVYWTFIGAGPQLALARFFEGLPTWYYAVLLFAFFVPVAFTEELVFRGFMIEHFLVKGAAFAVLFSSLLFTSLHIWYLSFGIHALPLLSGLFMLAVYWGIVYHKTRNIIGLILFHGLYNMTTAVGNLFPGSGADAAMSSAIFIIGMVCLGYLVFVYLRGLFMEIEQLVKGKGKV